MRRVTGVEVERALLRKGRRAQREAPATISATAAMIRVVVM